MATANIAVTEGSGKNVATNSITEDTITKQLSRNVLNNSSGVELGTATNPITTAISGSVLIQGSNSSIITAPLPASVSGVGNFNVNPVGSIISTIQSSVASAITTISASIAANLQSTNASVITFLPTTTTSVYAVLSSITTVSIMNVNTSRIGATIYNNAGTTAFIKLGVAATTSVFTVQLNANAYYELPYNYTGVVAGITASNAGIINVTEIQR